MTASDADSIEKFHKLKEQGIISEDEFQERKRAILSGNLAHSPHPQSSKRISAGVIALFFGGIGLHQFYIGRPGKGLVYLLLSWTLIPCILAFFEALTFLFTSDEKFNQFYDKTYLKQGKKGAT